MTYLLEKLTGLQLVKKFPAFHGTRRFITALTSVRQLSLSWASPIQSIYPHSTSWRSILILPTHLRLGLPSGLFPSGFPTKTLYTPLSSPIHATCPAHLIFLILSPAQYWVRSTYHFSYSYYNINLKVFGEELVVGHKTSSTTFMLESISCIIYGAYWSIVCVRIYKLNRLNLINIY